MTNKWIESFVEKPEEFLVVHGITLVGKELDVVECWWSGETWVIPSVRSSITSNNVLYWRFKPEIPKSIRKKYET